MDKKNNFIIKYLKYIGFNLDSEKYINQANLISQDDSLAKEIITKMSSNTQFNLATNNSLFANNTSSTQTSLFGNVGANASGSILNLGSRSTYGKFGQNLN